MIEMQASSTLAKPFVEGLVGKRLMYQYCESCRTAQTLARYACRACGEETLNWRQSKGQGRVHSVTEVGRAPTDAFKSLAPYTLAIVEFEEGFRLMGHAQAGLEIGDRVETDFFEHDSRVLLRFVRGQTS